MLRVIIAERVCIFKNYLYGYENKEFFHCRINTQTVLKFPDKLIGKGCPTTGVLSTRYVERKTADSIAAPRRIFEADSAAP